MKLYYCTKILKIRHIYLVFGKYQTVRTIPKDLEQENNNNRNNHHHQGQTILFIYFKPSSITLIFNIYYMTG